MAAEPSAPMMLSGRLGTKPATRSPGSTPAFSSAAGERNDGAMQLAPRQRPAAPRLVAIEDGRLTVPATEQVLGEVQPSVREEARARHPLGILEDTVAALADDAGEVPHGPPEVRRAIDRELVERSVVGDRRSVFLADIPHEPREVGVGHTLARRHPDWLCHITKNTLRS